MDTHRLTHADRELLLAGADLEAVLAEREREKLEPNGRTKERSGVVMVARLALQASRPGEEPGEGRGELRQGQPTSPST